MRLQYLAFLLSLVVVSVLGDPMPWTDAMGTSYEVGYTIGKTQSALIHRSLSLDTEINDVLLPCIKTQVGRMVFDSFVRDNQAYYWDYYDEIRGISDGSGVPLETVLLMNLRQEVGAFCNDSSTDAKKSDNRNGHCTDVLYHAPSISKLMRTGLPKSEVYERNNAGRKSRTLTLRSSRDASTTEDSKSSKVAGASNLLWGHNEDGDVWNRHNGYFVHAKIMTSNGSVMYEYWTYTYAGELGGSSFGFTQGGVMYSINELFPTYKPAPPMRGRGIQFVMRDVLRCWSIDEAVAAASVKNQAVGASYNLASYREQRMLNLETAANSSDTVTVQPGKNFFHVNVYNHLKQSQTVYNDSLDRIKRYQQFSLPRSAQEIVAILGDTQGQGWHIYNPNTLATGLFLPSASSLPMNRKSNAGPWSTKYKDKQHKDNDNDNTGVATGPVLRVFYQTNPGDPSADYTDIPIKT